MNDASYHGHLSYQPLENPTYILPDIRIKEELLTTKDHPNQAIKLENPEVYVPILNIKQELQDFEDPPYEPLHVEPLTEKFPFIAVKEDLLSFKDEPGTVDDLVVSAEDRDECHTDNENINLRDGSDDNLMALCEEKTVGNITVHRNTSYDSGVQLSRYVKSSESDCKIPSGHQYSKDIMKRMCKKEDILTIQCTKFQTRLHDTVASNKPITQHDINNTSEKNLRCNEKRLIICGTCRKCFSTPYSLKTHTRIHRGSKPYSCNTCHKCFSQLSNLKKHARIHTQSKPYSCDTCHKCFNQLSVLTRHTKTHTGSKPYSCDTCHKCFSQLSNLKTHTRIHTESKPYSCLTCHKCFNQLFVLKRHSKIHTGSKPYSCDTCHKCFSQLSNLKKHIRIHRE